ncbi:urea ABC transporter permease subunit UrtB [Klebsiella huaxiensis]|uniref:High-affinity branched-chain amino acid transport system permease protein LivH n=1 Tax=Klebsiella huaxiensis TaxID=2153354 RepID=A0A564LDX3_9ENTR|nr:urea ABC transporter permease subunit UrtB [Klebsiella huaxiensis]VUS79842.1 High-affinity branched-chain amino acid transport system permease protein LivH [Klebsiella huaxiensis]HCB1499083.1 urea ABC transporter permease subunit UrtB [Klebsiella michiganensis]HCB1845494.1 urea ABC transporter permease subunit UrtB [Klebsiella oxytoca]
MNALRLMSYFALLMVLIPWRAQAADADDFVAANRSQQAQLLEQWAAAPQAPRLPLLRALKSETLQSDNSGHAFIKQGENLLALGAASTPDGTTKPVRLTNRLRNLVAGALATHLLVSDNVTERGAAVKTLQREATPEMAGLLQQRLTVESDSTIKSQLEIALARLQLASPQSAQRLAAIELLGHSGDPETQALLTPLTDPQHEPNPAIRAAAQESLSKIQHRLLLGDLLGQAFMGLSLGSVLLLAALGLAITYGLLGVINMAHGEMLMIGAYSCWLVQQALAQLAPQWLAFYPLIALPVAFMVTGGIGMVLERTVIRHLYGRPLETLLATWGISLMLIQLVRMLFGAQNVEVANPAWLSGGVQVLPNLILPWNRLAVLAFVLLVLLFTWLTLNKTRLGMNVRAVTQNRAMAACCGVPTGRVDMLAFGLGSGIAGLGGVALSQLGNVGPELGQGYIIDSFLVVVLGGVGQLAGSVAAAFGLGIFNKILEPQMGAVLGKILILVMIILFIQKRPQGLFALKGRVID